MEQKAIMATMNSKHIREPGNKKEVLTSKTLEET